MALNIWIGRLWLAVAAASLGLLVLSLWPLFRGELWTGSLHLLAMPQSQASLASAGPGVAHGLLVEVPVPRAVALLSWVGLAAWSVAATVIALTMARLFAGFGCSDIFTLRNAGRLRRCGWLMIGAEAIRIAATLIQDLYVRNNIDSADWTLGTLSDRDVHLVFGGLVLLGVARAFRIGTRLRRQADLTV